MHFALLLFAVLSLAVLQPPLLPLAVRSPYLSIWLPGRVAPWAAQPQFYTGQSLDLQVMFQDSEGSTFGLINADGQQPSWYESGMKTEGAWFEFGVGHGKVRLEFINRIQSDVDLSTPATVLNITSTVDGSAMVLIGGNMISGCGAQDITWAYDSGVFEIKRSQEAAFTEIVDRAEWGTFVFAAERGSYSSSFKQELITQFTRTGTLFNGTLEPPKNINEGVAFAFSSNISSSWSIVLGHVQDPIVSYSGPDGIVLARPMWKESFTSVPGILSHVLTSPYTPMSIHSNISTHYSDLMKLVVLQTYGATQFAASGDIFLKEISSNGNFQTTDVIFPSSPLFLYLNPEHLRRLLEPLLEHQLAGLYPNKWAMHDIGTHFPNGTGHEDGNEENMPLEESGDMLLMVLAYAQRAKSQTSAVKWLKRYYSLFERWAKYLDREGLIPAEQICTDDFSGALANHTNLALKAIIGMRAFSEIAAATHHRQHARHFKQQSESYIKQWEEIAMSRDGKRVLLAYNWWGSWGLLYNIFFDRLLRLDLVPERVYKLSEKFYMNIMQQYGLPLDSRSLLTKSDWQLFIAATMSRPEEVIERVAKWVNETSTDLPSTDIFHVENGGWAGPHFHARPVLGGFFAPQLVQEDPHYKPSWAESRFGGLFHMKDWLRT